MKPYRAYSRTESPSEGSVLVIAHTVKEAKKIVWGSCLNIDKWIDQAVTLIKDNDILLLANQKKLQADIPHVIEQPLDCINCNFWGAGITVKNLCCNCNQYPGNVLIKKLRRR